MSLISSYTKYILSGLIVLMIGYKIWKLNRIDFNLDIWTKELQPIKQNMLDGSEVGVYDSIKNPARIPQLQYVLAPVIISDRTTADSLLFIRPMAQALDLKGNYTLIKEVTVQDVIISLAVKKK